MSFDVVGNRATQRLEVARRNRTCCTCPTPARGVAGQPPLGANSIKVYDKGSVLRMETTINNPSELRVLRRDEADGRRQLRWCVGASHAGASSREANATSVPRVLGRRSVTSPAVVLMVIGL